MTDPLSKRTRRRPPAIEHEDALRTLALAYLARFSTTRARLGDYLIRKLRAADNPDLISAVPAIVQAMDDLGYVNDQTFAEARKSSLSRRGYGPSRIRQSLRAAGVAPDMADETAVEIDEHEAAMAYARRRRFGPFAKAPMDEEARRKALGAMIRAGHAFSIAKLVLDKAPADT